MLTRREFLVASAAITASTAFDASAQAPRRGRSDILFILADGPGLGDLSCLWTARLQTPMLDDCSSRYPVQAGVRELVDVQPNARSSHHRAISEPAFRWAYTIPFQEALRPAAAAASDAAEPAEGGRISDGTRRQVAPGIPTHVRSAEERV